MTKKVISILSISAIFLSIISGYNVAAKEGEINDERVHMIYWDQNDILMYWTGVTNKTSANEYSPCVGIQNSDSSNCGKNTKKGEYNEINGWHTRHCHFLFSNIYQSIDYLVN